MARYEKRTNNVYRRTNARKENHKKKGNSPKIQELKSMTFEFFNTKERDQFYGSLVEVLKQKGLDRYFQKCLQKGNIMILSTKTNKPYRSENYQDLAAEMVRNIGNSKAFEWFYEDYCINLVKLSTRKGRKYLYFKIGIPGGLNMATFGKMTRNYNLIPGSETECITYSSEDENSMDDEEDWDW